MLRWLARRYFVACGGCGQFFGLFPPIRKDAGPLCRCGSHAVVPAPRCTFTAFVLLLFLSPLFFIGEAEHGWACLLTGLKGMRRTHVISALIAPAVLFGVGAVFHFLVPVISPNIAAQFANAALFRPWGDWTWIYMILHPCWFGVVFAAGHGLLCWRGALAPGWRDGLAYGTGVFIVGSLPVFMLSYASFQVSPELIASWVVQNAIQYVMAGIAIGWATGRTKK